MVLKSDYVLERTLFGEGVYCDRLYINRLNIFNSLYHNAKFALLNEPKNKWHSSKV